MNPYILGILAFSIPFIIGVTLMIVLLKSMKKRAKKLQDRFASLKPLQGKALDEIKAVCGKPVRGILVNNSETLYIWGCGKYQITLTFDSDNICTGVSGETLIL